MNGHGIPENKEEAVKCYEKAVELGRYEKSSLC